MTEREWREASDMRVSTLAVGSVLLTAAVLRFWGLGHGIPFAVGAGEPEIMDRAVQMMKSGDFNPHAFGVPAFYIYVQVVVSCLRFLVGASAGMWHSLAEVGAGDFYLWGRFVTAALGTATVFLLYQIGMRWGTRHALLGAALLALMPAHVAASHFVLSDVPATFLVTLAFLLSLQAHERGELTSFIAAGVAAGVAAATSYHGAIALLLPLMAAYMTRGTDRPRMKTALMVGGSFLLAVVLAAPFTVLDLPRFLDGFAALNHAAAGPAAPGWLVHLNALRSGLGWPALLLTFGGLGMFLVRVVTGPGQTRFAMVLVFLAVFFPLISTRPVISAHSIVPMVPFVCLLAGVAVVSGVSLLRRFDIPRWMRTGIIAGLTIAALLPPAVGAIRFDRQHSRRGTHALAYDWIVGNVPLGSRVALEAVGLRLPETRYRAEYVRSVTERDYGTWVTSGTDYLVIAWPAAADPAGSGPRGTDDRAAYGRLLAQASLCATILPAPGRPGPEFRILRVATPNMGDSIPR